MTRYEMEQLYDSIVAEERKLLFNKNVEYTRANDDALFNFKEIAGEINITEFKVWHVLFKKHYNSLVHWLKGGQMSSGESIESRNKDLRVYLFILRCLIIDKEKVNEKNTT